MEKENPKNRQTTEQLLLDSVHALIEEKGFEGLGVNAVAAQAGVSKMLIYRYFDSLDGLIAAYIQQNDYWINFEESLPDASRLGEFIKTMFRQQITQLKTDYTLKMLHRWELTSNHKMVKELREKRETKGIWLVDAISRLSHHSQSEVATIASLISAGISYLVLLSENCHVYNGIKIQQEKGWEELENGIDLLVDLWLNQNKQ